MTPDTSIELGYNGWAPNPVDWSVLDDIFITFFGENARSLDRFPTVIGGVWASWIDASGVTHEADTLQDVEEAYRDKETYSLHFRDLGERDLVYWPGGQPRVVARVKASSPEEVDALLAPVREAFPLQRRVVFISWAKPQSQRVAEALRDALEPRMPPGGEVFFSAHMRPGVNPLNEMLDRNLLNADAHLAVITQDALESHWVTWEVAASWARAKTVIPVFTEVRPNELRSPLPHLAQGVHIDDDRQLKRAIEVVLTAVGGEADNALSEEELDAPAVSRRCRRG